MTSSEVLLEKMAQTDKIPNMTSHPRLYSGAVDVTGRIGVVHGAHLRLSVLGSVASFSVWVERAPLFLDVASRKYVRSGMEGRGVTPPTLLEGPVCSRTGSQFSFSPPTSKDAAEIKVGDGTAQRGQCGDVVWVPCVLSGWTCFFWLFFNQMLVYF